MAKQTKKIYRSKYPIALIENDFIIKRLRYKELQEKYKVSEAIIAYYSKKYNWLEKRNSFFDKVKENTQSKALEDRINSDYNLINEIEKLIKLKLSNEIKAQLLANPENLRDLTLVLSKSKDNIVELTKLRELLSGKPTEKVELNNIPDEADYNLLTNLALNRKRIPTG